MATVDELQTTTKASIEQYRLDLVDKLDDLANFRATTYSPNTVAQPSFDLFNSIKVDEFDAIEPTSIKLTDPSANGYVPLAANSLPAYTAATADNGLLDDFTDAFKAISPTLFTWLHDQIRGIVESGGANISAEVQDAVFNTGRERDLQTLRDMLDATGAKTGAKGARYPNSMTKAMQAYITTQYMNQRNDMSREIVKTMANLSQENLKTAIAAGVGVDQARAAVFNQTAATLAELERVAIEKYRSDLTANLQKFEGQLRLQLLDLEVQKIDRDEQRAFISAQREQLELDAKVRLSEFEAKNKLKLLQAEVDKMIEELKTGGNEQKIRAFATYVQQLTDAQKINLAEVQARNTLQTTALTGVATGYAEIMKSMSAQAVSIVTKKSTV